MDTNENTIQLRTFHFNAHDNWYMVRQSSQDGAKRVTRNLNWWIVSQ